jgi:hypothetical protein
MLALMLLGATLGGVTRLALSGEQAPPDPGPNPASSPTAQPDLEGRFYDARKVAKATESQDAARALCSETAAAVRGYESMLRDVLTKKPSNKIALLMIRELRRFRLSASSMELLCHYLGTVDTRMVTDPGSVKDPQIRAAMQWIDKQNEFTKYPAFTTLLVQGVRAVPALKKFTARAKTSSPSFRNATRLLFEIWGPEQAARWFSSKEDTITAERRKKALELMSIWHGQRQPENKETPNPRSK